MSHCGSFVSILLLANVQLVLEQHNKSDDYGRIAFSAATQIMFKINTNIFGLHMSRFK